MLRHAKIFFLFQSDKLDPFFFISICQDRYQDRIGDALGDSLDPRIDAPSASTRCYLAGRTRGSPPLPPAASSSHGCNPPLRFTQQFSDPQQRKRRVRGQDKNETDIFHPSSLLEYADLHTGHVLTSSQLKSSKDLTHAVWKMWLQLSTDSVPLAGEAAPPPSSSPASAPSALRQIGQSQPLAVVTRFSAAVMTSSHILSPSDHGPRAPPLPLALAPPPPPPPPTPPPPESNAARIALRDASSARSDSAKTASTRASSRSISSASAAPARETRDARYFRLLRGSPFPLVTSVRG